MNKFFIKVIYFFIFYKSKILKNKIFKSGNQIAENFKSKIKKYDFNVFWFLNNLEIFNYFFPRDLNTSLSIPLKYLVNFNQGQSAKNMLKATPILLPF